MINFMLQGRVRRHWYGSEWTQRSELQCLSTSRRNDDHEEYSSLLWSQTQKHVQSLHERLALKYCSRSVYTLEIFVWSAVAVLLWCKKCDAWKCIERQRPSWETTGSESYESWISTFWIINFSSVSDGSFYFYCRQTLSMNIKLRPPSCFSWKWSSIMPEQVLFPWHVTFESMNEIWTQEFKHSLKILGIKELNSFKRLRLKVFTCHPITLAS